jgi:hypothetical protein
MKPIRQQITSNQLFSFLILVMLAGLVIQYITSVIEINGQTLFMDITLGVFAFLAGIKFVIEQFKTV